MKAAKPATKRTRKHRKQKVLYDTWPRIRERAMPSGVVSYEVDGRRMVNGRKVGTRSQWGTLDEAKIEAQRLRDKNRMHGGTAIMSKSSEQDAQFALRLLQDGAPSVRLSDVVKDYLATRASIRRKAKLEDLAEKYAAKKEADGASPRYAKDIRLRFRHLCADFGAKYVHELTGDELATWIDERKGAPISKANYRRALDVFFSFAVENGYAARNPLEGRQKPVVRITKKPGILSVEETVALLFAADERIVPALAIGAFAGLRPEAEINRLTWDSVNLERIEDEAKSKKGKLVYKSWGHIHVRAGQTKTRSGGGIMDRYVPISENLWYWLIDRKPPKGGPVVSVAENYFHELRQAAVQDAKLKEWPHDALRHGAGSYHFATFMNKAQTMAMLGHTSRRTFEVHYCHTMPRAEAEAYWQIMPEIRGERKIVHLALAGSRPL
jgi:integrase